MKTPNGGHVVAYVFVSLLWCVCGEAADDLLGVSSEAQEVLLSEEELAAKAIVQDVVKALDVKFQTQQARENALATALAEQAALLGKRPAVERLAVLRAIPAACLAEAGLDGAAGAARLIENEADASLCGPLRAAIEKALSRVEQGAMPAQPVRASLAELCGRFALALAKLGDSAAPRLALESWKAESREASTAFSLAALVLIGRAEHEPVFAAAFRDARQPEVRATALRGLVRVAPARAPASARDWLAEAIESGDAQVMGHVRTALVELQAQHAAVASDAARQLLRDMKKADSRAVRLAALEVALFAGLRLRTIQAEAGQDLLAAVTDAASAIQGGTLYRRTAMRALDWWSADLTDGAGQAWQAVAHRTRQVAPGAFEIGKILAGRDGGPLPAGAAASGYGADYRVLSAGQDIRDAWLERYGENLQVAQADLGGANWAQRPVPRNTMLVDAVQGRLRFPVGEESAVKVLGKTTPGETLFFEWPDRVVLRGKYAYMSNGENWDAGFAQVDISDPANPRIVAHSYVGGFARGIQLYKHFAYVAGSIPTLFYAPSGDAAGLMKWHSRLGAFQGDAVGIEPDRGLLLAASQGHLTVFDLADPTNLVAMGRVALSGPLKEVRALGSLACAACGAGGIQIVDVSDPKQPREVGRHSVADAYDVKLRPGMVYVSDIAQGQILILDIANPAEPRELGRIGGLNRNGIRFDLAERGGRLLLFAAEYGGGCVRSFDVTDPESPRPLGVWNNPTPWPGLPGRGGNLTDISVSGHLAVVANMSFGLHVLDVSDPAKTALLGEVRLAGEAGNVKAIDDNTVLVGDFNQGLLVLDAGDPARIRIVGQYHHGGRIWPGLVWKAPFCIISHQFPGGLTMVDVTDLRRPKPVSVLRYDSIGLTCALAYGEHAYLAHRYGYDITVLDLSEAGRMRIASRAAGVSDHPALAAVNGLLLAANSSAESGGGPLSVFDITEPSHARLIGQIELAPGCSSVSAQGDVAWVTGGGRLRAIDVSNPFQPRMLSDVPMNIGDVKVSGEYLYAITGTGLTVHRIPLWAADNDAWVGFSGPECVGQTGDLHPKFLRALDVRGPRAYLLAHNQLFCVEVPWSQTPVQPVLLIKKGH